MGPNLARYAKILVAFIAQVKHNDLMGFELFKSFNLTAESLLAGQDPKGLVMCFFKHSDRVRIRAIRVNGTDYRGGRLVAPPLDQETGCTAEEMAAPIPAHLVRTKTLWEVA
jgi:hypothetical protein